MTTISLMLNTQDGRHVNHLQNAFTVTAVIPWGLLSKIKKLFMDSYHEKAPGEAGSHHPYPSVKMINFLNVRTKIN